jgi:hypothetical protein
LISHHQCLLLPIYSLLAHPFHSQRIMKNWQITRHPRINISTERIGLKSYKLLCHSLVTGYLLPVTCCRLYVASFLLPVNHRQAHYERPAVFYSSQRVNKNIEQPKGIWIFMPIALSQPHVACCLLPVACFQL